MAAGCVTLDLLTSDVYGALEETGADLEAGLRDAASAAGRVWCGLPQWSYQPFQNSAHISGPAD